MINPVLSRRRSIPVIVRRSDVVPGVRSRGATLNGTMRRRGNRRARRRGIRRGENARSVLVAVGVLMAASIAWILTFVYLASLG